MQGLHNWECEIRLLCRCYCIQGTWTETAYRKPQAGPSFLRTGQASTRGPNKNRRLKPELDETGTQPFDVHGICKERHDVMIKDRQSRRSGSADGSVADPAHNRKMKPTDTDTFLHVDAFTTICRPLLSTRTEKRQKVCQSPDDLNESAGPRIS